VAAALADVDAMNIASVASSVVYSIPAAGSGPVDPATAQAQVNAQADTLTALMGAKHNTTVAANVSDGQGVDLYL
jgi:hypothetical protein